MPEETAAEEISALKNRVSKLEGQCLALMNTLASVIAQQPNATAFARKLASSPSELAYGDIAGVDDATAREHLRELASQIDGTNSAYKLIASMVEDRNGGSDQDR